MTKLRKYLKCQAQVLAAALFALPLLLLSACHKHPETARQSGAYFDYTPYERIAQRLSEAHKILSNRKIAVLPFSYLDQRLPEDGAVISERILTRIINIRKLEAVERSLLKKVLGELKLQHSGIVDQSTAKQFGKFLGVEALVTGTLIRRRDGLIEVNARLILTESGAIVAAAGEVLSADWDSQPLPVNVQPPRETRPEAKRPLPVRMAPVKDPVRWWRAEGSVRDEMTGFEGTLRNDAGYGPGAYGRAFSLAGFRQYVSAGYEPLYDSLFDGRHPFSFSFWINHSGKDAPQGIFSKGEDPLMTALYMNNAAYNYGLTFSIKNGYGSKIEALFGQPGPRPGVWEHWTATYDGSGRVNGMKVYRNGSPQDARFPSDSFGDNIMLNPSPLEFGRLAGNLNWHYSGRLDDLRLYNRVLEEKEIIQLASGIAVDPRQRDQR